MIRVRQAAIETYAATYAQRGVWSSGAVRALMRSPIGSTTPDRRWNERAASTSRTPAVAQAMRLAAPSGYRSMPMPGKTLPIRSSTSIAADATRAVPRTAAPISTGFSRPRAGRSIAAASTAARAHNATLHHPVNTTRSLPIAESLAGRPSSCQ